MDKPYSQTEIIFKNYRITHSPGMIEYFLSCGLFDFKRNPVEGNLSQNLGAVEFVVNLIRLNYRVF